MLSGFETTGDPTPNDTIQREEIESMVTKSLIAAIDQGLVELHQARKILGGTIAARPSAATAKKAG